MVRATTILCFLAVAFASAATPAQGEKFKVEVYDESFCPYCRDMLLSSILPMLDNGLLDFLDFTVIPAGNQHLKKGKITCQHGPNECYLNVVLLCVTDQYPDIKQWLPIMSCIEDNPSASVSNSTVVEVCASKNGANGPAILKCAAGKRGKQLQQKAFDETQGLAVPHQWVPWVVFDGVPLFDAGYYLQQFVCVNLPEDKRPKQCYKDPFPISATENGLKNDVFNALEKGPRRVGTGKIYREVF